MSNVDPLIKSAGGPGSGKSRDSTEEISELEKSPLITIHKRKKVMNHRGADRTTDLDLDKITYGAQTTYDIEKLGWMLSNHEEWKDEPIQVARIDGEHHLMDGHHRFLAATRLGDNTLPAEVWVLDKNEVQEVTGQKTACMLSQLGHEKTAVRGRFSEGILGLGPVGGNAVGESFDADVEKEGALPQLGDEGKADIRYLGKDSGQYEASARIKSDSPSMVREKYTGGFMAPRETRESMAALNYTMERPNAKPHRVTSPPGSASMSASVHGTRPIGEYPDKVQRGLISGRDHRKKRRKGGLIGAGSGGAAGAIGGAIAGSSGSRRILPALAIGAAGAGVGALGGSQIGGMMADDPEEADPQEYMDEHGDGSESLSDEEIESAQNEVNHRNLPDDMKDGADVQQEKTAIRGRFFGDVLGLGKLKDRVSNFEMPSFGSSTTAPRPPQTPSSDTAGSVPDSVRSTFEQSRRGGQSSTKAQTGPEIDARGAGAKDDGFEFGLKDLGFVGAGAGAVGGAKYLSDQSGQEKTSEYTPVMAQEEYYSNLNNETIQIKGVGDDVVEASGGDNTWKERLDAVREKIREGDWERVESEKEAARIPGPVIGAGIGGLGGAGVNYLKQRANMYGNAGPKEINPYSSARSALIGAGIGGAGPVVARKADDLITKADETMRRAEGVMGDVEETRKAVTESAQEISETARQARGAIDEAEGAGKAVRETAEKARDSRFMGVFNKGKSQTEAPAPTGSDPNAGRVPEAMDPNAALRNISGPRNTKEGGVKEGSVRSEIGDAFINWARKTDSGSPDEFRKFLSEKTTLSSPDVRARPTQTGSDMGSVQFGGGGTGPEMLEVQSGDEAYILPSVGKSGEEVKYHDELQGIIDDGRTGSIGSVTPVSKRNAESTGELETDFRVPVGETRVSSRPDRTETANALVGAGLLGGGGYGAYRHQQGKDPLPDEADPFDRGGIDFASGGKNASERGTITVEASDLGVMEAGFDFSSGLQGQEMTFDFSMPDEVELDVSKVEEPSAGRTTAGSSPDPKEVDTPEPETPDAEVKKPKQMVA